MTWTSVVNFSGYFVPLGYTSDLTPVFSATGR